MKQLLNKFTKVMEPINYPTAFNNSDYIYQVKWDGVRILSFIDGEQIRLINKHQRDKTLQYPELHRLSDSINAHSAILDGELVVMKNNRPSFPLIMCRDRSMKKETIKDLQTRIPVNYMLFDILYLDGKDLRNMKLTDRRQVLEDIIIHEDFLHLLDNFNEGESLFNSVKSMGLEGIIAKKSSSLYKAGKLHHEWWKIKCWRSQNCMVGGYTVKANKVNSLLLGVYRDEEFTFAGRAASGLGYKDLDILSKELPLIEIKHSPFANLPDSVKGYHYVKPLLGLEIEFLEWTEKLHFRSAIIKGFKQLNAQQCTV